MKLISICTIGGHFHVNFQHLKYNMLWGTIPSYFQI